MEFQQFFDPFGTMLKSQGAALANEGQSIENQTNLVRLGQAKEQLELTKKANAETAEAFNAASGLSGGNIDPGASGMATPSALYQNGKAKGGLTPTDQINSDLNDITGQIQLNKNLAQIRARANDNKGAQEYLAKIPELLTRRQAAIKEQNDLNLQRTDDLANMFEEMAKGPTQTGNAIAAMMEKHPEFDPSTLESKFGFKMMGGYPVYDKDKALSLAHAMRQGKDQMTVANHEATQAYTKQLRDIEQKSLELREREANQRSAEQRDRDRDKSETETYGKLPVGYKWVDPKDKSKGMEAIPKQGDPKVNDKAVATLEKDPLFKNYDRYQQAEGAAVMVKSKLSSGQELQAADVQQLRAHYANAIQDFRARAGGVKDLQEFNRLNGNLQVLDKWIESFGRGTPAADNSVAKTAADVIEREHLERTTNLAMTELRAARNVEKGGGSPDRLPLKADIPFLVRNGRASIKPDEDNKKWVAIRDDNGDIHTYPYPEEAYK